MTLVLAVGTGQSWKSGDDKIGCYGGFGEKMVKIGGKKKEADTLFSATVRIGSGGLRVARGGFGAKAPPLAARPVPRNGRGRRLVKLTSGC